MNDDDTPGDPSDAHASSADTDVDRPDGVVDEATKRSGLPPGAGTRGDDDDDRLSGAAREAAPYDDAPADGKFAPDADNPPPP